MGNTNSSKSQRVENKAKKVNAETQDKKVGTSRTPLPWKGGLEEFQFLKIKTLCKYSDMGISEDDHVTLFTDNGHAIIVSTNNGAVIFDTSRSTIRALTPSREPGFTEIAHSLSPDGRVVIRWKSNAEYSVCDIEAVRVETNTSIARLQNIHVAAMFDPFSLPWSGNSVVYLPGSTRGTFTRWSLDDNGCSTTTFCPLSAIVRHDLLSIRITKDERWWVVCGRKDPNHNDIPSGLIQVHNVERNEEKIVSGVVFCLDEVEVYGRAKTLIFIGDVIQKQLSLKIQQLDPDAPGEPFQSVDVSIVVMATSKCGYYFFEIHSGAYLFSKRFSSTDNELVQGIPNDGRRLLLKNKQKQRIDSLSVNTDHLIGYIRQVLKNDTLASSVAIRTGLPGAYDVIFNDMHAEYRDENTRVEG